MSESDQYIDDIGERRKRLDTEGLYEAACSYDGWSTPIKLALGMNLQVGDPVYRDPEKPYFGKCPLCQRYSLRITKTPNVPSPEPPQGFWKIPTE